MGREGRADEGRGRGGEGEGRGEGREGKRKGGEGQWKEEEDEDRDNGGIETEGTLLHMYVCTVGDLHSYHCHSMHA